MYANCTNMFIGWYDAFLVARPNEQRVGENDACFILWLPTFSVTMPGFSRACEGNGQQ